MCDLLDLEPCKIWHEEPVTARRLHRCDACGGPIPKSAPYLRHASLFDGRWTREAMCFGCWWVREAFAAEHGQSCLPSALVDVLQECVSWDGPDSAWRGPLALVLRRNRAAVRAASLEDAP